MDVSDDIQNAVARHSNSSRRSFRSTQNCSQSVDEFNAPKRHNNSCTRGGSGIQRSSEGKNVNGGKDEGFVGFFRVSTGRKDNSEAEAAIAGSCVVEALGERLSFTNTHRKSYLLKKDAAARNFKQSLSFSCSRKSLPRDEGGLLSSLADLRRLLAMEAEQQ